MRADQPPQVLNTDYFVDLADDRVGGESGARVDQHRLITLFDQVDVALELVARQERTHPPNARCELYRTRGVEVHGPSSHPGSGLRVVIWRQRLSNWRGA